MFADDGAELDGGALAAVLARLHPAQHLLFDAQYLEPYLILHLGRIRLADLTTEDIAAMLAQLEQTPDRRGTPLATASLPTATDRDLRTRQPAA